MFESAKQADQNSRPAHTHEIQLLAKQTSGFLLRMLQSDALGHRYRAEAGHLISLLGDPRFRQDFHYLPDEPNLGFVHIASGEFSMGVDAHPVSLPAYYIARYHTTVAQFRAFVNATGFEPENQQCLEGDDNQPVAWISWYEAIAYCNWLNGVLKAYAQTQIELQDQGSEHVLTFWRHLASSAYSVSLPSEAEWEKAARGDTRSVYPWGDNIDLNKANYKETQLHGVCTVGSFPQGTSPYGILDMAGNAWEWLRTLWGTEEDKSQYDLPYIADDGRENLSASSDVLRCMRGGAFTVEAARAASTFRDGVPPGSRDDADGFRVVITSELLNKETGQ